MLLLPAIGWLWLAGLTTLGLLGFDVRRHHFESAGLGFGVGFVVFVLAHRQPWPRVIDRHDGPSRAVLMLPAAAALIAFGWSLALGPLSDDFVLRTWASSGEWTPAGWTYLRPFPLALWSAVTAGGGGWPLIHAVNVLAHALNSSLVAVLSSSWVGPRAGLVAGLVFALFPASTEAVVWSAGVFDLLATLFVLLAAIVWTRWPPSPQRTLSLSLICLAGFLSKESAIVIPLILALITGVTMSLQRQERRQHGRPLALTLLLAAGFVTMRLLWSGALAGHLDKLPSDRRQWKDLLVRPFAALAVPARTDTGITTEAYLVGLAVLVLIGAAMLQVSRRSARAAATREPASGQLLALTIGAGWILLSSLSLLMQFYVSPTLEGSRYLYLPSVGFALAVSAAFADWHGARQDVVPSVALLVLLSIYSLGLSTERQVWLEAAKTRDTLLRQAAETVRAAPCRTLTIVEAPDNIKGAFVFREGLSEALASLPWNPNGHPCVFRWNGSVLVPAGVQPAS